MTNANIIMVFGRRGGAHASRPRGAALARAPRPGLLLGRQQQQPLITGRGARALLQPAACTARAWLCLRLGPDAIILYRPIRPQCLIYV